MTIQSKSQKTYSVEEYLEMEPNALEKHEFRNGIVCEMPRGTYYHGLLGGNIIATLHHATLESEKFRVCSSDVRVYIEKFNHFVYPDALIILEQPVFYKKRTDTIVNPLVVVEVLSKSTQKRDQTSKFEEYKSLESFKEYLLIHQYKYELSHWTKLADGTWQNTIYSSLEEQIPLPSLEASISMKAVYRFIEIEKS